MSTIDEIMDQASKYAIAWTDACTCGMCDEHITHVHQLEVKSALRNLIAAALADARREGAEAMREAAGDAAQRAAGRGLSASAMHLCIRALPTVDSASQEHKA